MTDRIQEILRASATLDALNRRIKETVLTRNRGVEERERWSRACAEFHRRYPELFYPGGDAALDALKRRESEAIQTAIDFLEADPFHHRSGYTKEEVWRRLRNSPLLQLDKRRLEQTSLSYLERRTSREFWEMARTMAVHASNDFWRKVREIAQSAAEPRKTRASYLLAYERGAAAGGQLRMKVQRERLMQKFRDRP